MAESDSRGATTKNAELADSRLKERGRKKKNKKAKEKKAAKRKHAKDKSAPKEKRGKREVTELDRMLARMALRGEVPPEVPPEVPSGESTTTQKTEPAEPRPKKRKRKAAHKKAKEEKAAKRKRAKSKSEGKEKSEKSGKRKGTKGREPMAQKGPMTEAPPGESIPTQKSELAESKPQKPGRKAADKKAKKEQAAKQTRAKNKSAAKEKPRKRKDDRAKKVAPDSGPTAEATPSKGVTREGTESVESKPRKPGRKAADKKAKEEKAANEARAKSKPAAKEKPAKKKVDETEKIKVKEILATAAIPAAGAAGREVGPDIVDQREEPGADESVYEAEVAQPEMPIIPPPIRGSAPASPSRFWPKVALGTVAVIAGFGYVRHLAKDQALQIPGALVTADSQREVTSEDPAAVDAAIATRRPSAPSDEARAPVFSDQAGAHATRSDVGSEPAVAGPQKSSPGVSHTADLPQAGDSEKHAVKTGSVKAENLNARTPVVRPRAQTEITGWQMPRPYRPYPPQYRRVYPAYPPYLCPVDPQVYWYPRSAARRSGRGGK